jgi:hypothetical protein
LDMEGIRHQRLPLRYCFFDVELANPCFLALNWPPHQPLASNVLRNLRGGVLRGATAPICEDCGSSHRFCLALSRPRGSDTGSWSEEAQLSELGKISMRHILIWPNPSQTQSGIRVSAMAADNPCICKFICSNTACFTVDLCG